MIKSYRHRGVKNFFVHDDRKFLNPNYVKRLEILLDTLDTADAIKDMDFPGTQLHELKGDRKGTWSVKVSGNWRLTFRFENGHAYDVNLEDYH